MNAFGGNKPMFLKTYGKQKRKIDPWFSPELRKKVFSFSSSLSSDQSVSENTHHRRRKRKSTAVSRTAHRPVMESDEEYLPDPALRKKISSKPVKKTVTKKLPGRRGVRTTKTQSDTQHKISKKSSRQTGFSSSETEEDSCMKKSNNSTAFRAKTSAEGDIAEKRESSDPPVLGRFITQRRRAQPVQPKQSFGLACSLNSSEDFVGVSVFPQRVTRRKQFNKENSELKPSSYSTRIQSRAVLCDVSFNDSDELQVSCKHPLLSSTPSVVFRRNLHILQSPISQISSLSCDELNKLPPKHTTRDSKPTPGEAERERQSSHHHHHHHQTADKLSSCAETAEKKERESEMCVDTSSVIFVSAQTHLDSQVEQLKNRCLSLSPVVLLERIDVKDILSAQSCDRKQEVEERRSLCVQPLTVNRNAGSRDRRTFNVSDGDTCPESSSSPVSPLLSSPVCLLSDADQDLIDRLKVECLSSCLTVSLQPLDPHVLFSVQQRTRETLTAQTVSPHPHQTTPHSPQTTPHPPQTTPHPPQTSPHPLQTTPHSPQTSPHPPQTSPHPPQTTERTHLSACVHTEKTHLCEGQSDGQIEEVVRSPVSPAVSVAVSKAQKLQEVRQRHGSGAGSGTGTGTARKAGVSGLSVSRWSKKSVCEPNPKQQKKKKKKKLEDCSLNYLLPAGTHTHTGESVSDGFPGSSSMMMSLPVTPLKVDQLNLSSVLANFSPDTLTTQSWGRLKAALSIHKKKMAFLTPRRLALSGLMSPAGIDTSLDLFASPQAVNTPLSKLMSSPLSKLMSSPLSKLMSSPLSKLVSSPLSKLVSSPLSKLVSSPHPHLLSSSMTSTFTTPDEEISDAEKVYQECQQDGPVSFDDCIPPERMRCCVKIGEGTFGEVFSTVNSSGQTVALKIIPVEGCQKVNGEPQKTFGEILHEIIISKELSSLDSTQNNRTDGFIGLNDLHCVQGCYPAALLQVWDTFDQKKGSENDRPDFFSADQLFVILEFEFGGSDLENMNGKLSSMAQAHSVVHQVTAALAVAEQALRFEHRDLHWGNILLKSTKDKLSTFTLNGQVYSVETRGVHVNIIDYSLSRLEIDGLTVVCDISEDEQLFEGQGDYQFEIYRLMKKENRNCWSDYNPHSNVLWLHYLLDKLLSMKYKTRSHNTVLKKSLKHLQSQILTCSSASEALLTCSFYQ